MSLNWKEIDLVLSELELEGRQIQKVFQSGYDTLAMQVYGKTGSALVLVALSPGACRIHETFRAVPKSEKPLRFAEFLKARIVNGWIEEAVQLGDNRIVRLGIRRGENRYRLYIRLWSNAANVIVTGEDGLILDAMRRLPKRGEITGGVYRPEETPAAPAKEGYEIREFDGSPDASFNKKADDFYAEHGGGLSLEKLREQAVRIIGSRVNRLETAIERLGEKEAEYKNAGRWKEYGDIILANAAAADGAWLEAVNFFSADKETIRIALDEHKTPPENAEYYYEKYRKGKKGLAGIQEELAESRAELERLRETEKRFLAESNPLVLGRLLGRFRASDHRAGESAAKKRPGLSFQDGDWLIIVGRDVRENDELLRRHVKGNDLWLHARDYAGSYIFIKQRSGKTVPLEILLDAGNLALFYSKGRNNGSGNCYYTQVKYLRRAKNGPRGKVLPSQEKNLFIKIEQKRLKNLEAARV